MFRFENTNQIHTSSLAKNLFFPYIQMVWSSSFSNKNVEEGETILEILRKEVKAPEIVFREDIECQRKELFDTAQESYFKR